MHENRKVEIKAGFFIVLGTVAIMSSLFLLGADRALFSKFIRLHAHFDQVQGLARGSTVSLSGLVVGTVESIVFTGERNDIDVVFKIEKDYQHRITSGSRVDIRTQGALGDKFIFITPGESGQAVIPDSGTIEVVKSSDLISIIGQRSGEAEKLFDIINNINIITTELAELSKEQKISRLIHHLSSAAKNLESTSADSKQLISTLNSSHIEKPLKESLDKLNKILARIDSGQGTLGALINDPTLHDQVSQFLGASPRKKYLKNAIRTTLDQGSEK